MKKYSIILLSVLLAACQPHFDMVPPDGSGPVAQEFTENWYVTQNGSGSKDGSDWSNALPFKTLIQRISSSAASFSDAGIHIQEGTYLLNAKDSCIVLNSDILCIRGGYSSDLKYDDLSKCDPDMYPTIFTGDVNGDGVANDGDAAFAYVSEASVRFENITFRNFYLSPALNSKLGSKGGAVFGINGQYLTTSVECRNCIFEGNANGISSSANQEGGPCAYVWEGYFKARGCAFIGNAANSRGGAIRTNGKSAVIFLDACFFKGNRIEAQWGSAIQNSAGVICANNCTMIQNTGAGSTLNGGGAFFLANCTILDDAEPSGSNNAAFRCESKANCGTMLINNVLGSTNAAGYGLILNAGGTLLSKGYNLIKSAYLADGCSDPTLTSDLKKDVVLAGSLDEDAFCWEWDFDQIKDDFLEFAVTDDVYDAAVLFDPSGYCSIAVLGRAFATWATPNAFAVDCRGEIRGDDGFQPGAYDPNLD